ncbi:MAG: hypothetical protein ACI845_002268 [Gammaproteobacteria bacterium]|jgi:hypothetical protein
MQAEKITPIRNDNSIQFQSGTIGSCDDLRYQILCHGELYNATRAFSCLVEPMQDDTVVFSIDSSRRCHIHSIIERHASDRTNLEFPGDVTLNAARGNVSINGREGINISSEKTMRQSAEEFTLIAKKALFSVDNITAIGSRLSGKFKNIQTIADSVETIADNLIQKLKNSFRLIDGLDQSRATEAIHTVKNLYSLRSKQAAILAKKDIKMDAERIHMG